MKIWTKFWLWSLRRRLASVNAGIREVEDDILAAQVSLEERRGRRAFLMMRIAQAERRGAVATEMPKRRQIGGGRVINLPIHK